MREAKQRRRDRSEARSARTNMAATGEHLFIFDDLIADTANVTRRVNAAVKHPEPVLVPDRPWEGNCVLLFGRALFDPDDGLLKMWYATGPDYKLIGYATSTDGLAWTKPALDAVRIDGRPTNIVFNGRGTTYFEPFGVVKDRLDPDPSRRYKCAFKSALKPYEGPDEHPFMPKSKRGVGTLVSADGIRWRLESAFTNPDVCDIAHFFQEPADGSFVMHSRTKLIPETNDGRWKHWGWGRAVARIDSPDFRTWTREKLVFAADHEDPEGTEIYSLAVFPYADRYLGLAQMFHGLEHQGRLDMQLVTSDDAWSFSRVEPRTPFIAEGDVGSWDRFNIAVGDMPPVTVGDQHRFYYSARNYRHNPYDGRDTAAEHWSAIGVASVPRGRFLALEASFDGGTVTTTPIVPCGPALELNVNAAYGRADVEVLDVEGHPLRDCTAVVTGVDGATVRVPFPPGGPTRGGDKTVRLRVTLRNAQFYGFRFAP